MRRLQVSLRPGLRSSPQDANGVRPFWLPGRDIILPMKSRARRLFVVLLAAAVLAGCGGGSQAETEERPQDFRSAASDAAAAMLDLKSYFTDIRLDFTFIHASHGDDASEELQATVVGADYQLSRQRSGMGLSSTDQWLYSAKTLYTGDGTIWQPVSKNATDLPLPPGGVLDDMSSFEVTGQGPNADAAGVSCRTYNVTSNREVVWAWAPNWLRELDTNLDFSCKGTIYLGAVDGLTRLISLRLEGNDKDTGLLKLSVNLDATYDHFNLFDTLIPNPEAQIPVPTPGS